MTDTKPTAFVAAAERAARRRADRMPVNPVAGDVELIGRPTPRRTEVLQALAASEEFVSAQLLYTRLVQAGSRVGLSTVYRTLTALAEVGRADVVREANGMGAPPAEGWGRLFRYRPGPDHRHYLICRACGLGLPVDSTAVEAWTEHIAEISGFDQVQHTVELAGICPNCRTAA